MPPLTILIYLIAAHFVCDYPLQGDYLAKAKNKWSPVEGTPWYQAMTAHCFIHATAVLLITGMTTLFVAEFIIHFATDMNKCKKKISFNTDQSIHIVCKFFWWFIVIRYAY